MEPFVEVIQFKKRNPQAVERPAQEEVVADDHTLSAFHAAFELDLWARPAPRAVTAGHHPAPRKQAR